MVMVVATMARSQGASPLCCIFFNDEPPPAETLGILAFDAAKTMCRLVSLYKSLTDDEIYKLRRHIIRSKGVSFLNSQEECFLLNLACAERLEDLNFAAAAVSRLGRHCSNMGLNRFDQVYADLKRGAIDIKKLEFDTRHVQKIIDKMEKLVSSTRNLHMAMESLVEMEASEKKIQRWKNMRANHGLKVKVECFEDRIVFHRKQVQYYKQVSLWNQSFDKSVGLMARIICIIYARICSAFGSLISGTPSRNKNNNHKHNMVLRPKLKNCSCLLEHKELYQANIGLFDRNANQAKNSGSNSGPVLKTSRTGVIRFPSIPFPLHIATRYNGGDAGCCHDGVAKNNKVLRLAPPSTVGGAGLSFRYANLIMFVERCVHAPSTIGNEARAAVYELLPGRLKAKVRAKLMSQRLKWEDEMAVGGDEGQSAVAEGWRDTVEDVMEWLAPVAHDTVRWQAERNVEKQKFDTRPTVLLLQTLHYSDLEKVEAAMVDVLVGLSCIYWYKNQHPDLDEGRCSLLETKPKETIQLVGS